MNWNPGWMNDLYRTRQAARVIGDTAQEASRAEREATRVIIDGANAGKRVRRSTSREELEAEKAEDALTAYQIKTGRVQPPVANTTNAPAVPAPQPVPAAVTVAPVVAAPAPAPTVQGITAPAPTVQGITKAQLDELAAELNIAGKRMQGMSGTQAEIDAVRTNSRAAEAKYMDAIGKASPNGYVDLAAGMKVNIEGKEFTLPKGRYTPVELTTMLGNALGGGAQTLVRDGGAVHLVPDRTAPAPAPAPAAPAQTTATPAPAAPAPAPTVAAPAPAPAAPASTTAAPAAPAPAAAPVTVAPAAPKSEPAPAAPAPQPGAPAPKTELATGSSITLEQLKQLPLEKRQAIQYTLEKAGISTGHNNHNAFAHGGGADKMEGIIGPKTKGGIDELAQRRGISREQVISILVSQDAKQIEALTKPAGAAHSAAPASAQTATPAPERLADREMTTGYKNPDGTVTAQPKKPEDYIRDPDLRAPLEKFGVPQHSTAAGAQQTAARQVNTPSLQDWARAQKEAASTLNGTVDNAGARVAPEHRDLAAKGMAGILAEANPNNVARPAQISGLQLFGNASMPNTGAPAQPVNDFGGHSIQALAQRPAVEAAPAIGEFTAPQTPSAAKQIAQGLKDNSSRVM